MFRIALLIALAFGFTTSTTEAQTKLKVRDPIARKFQPEKGFFEPVKSSPKATPTGPKKSSAPVLRIFRFFR